MKRIIQGLLAVTIAATPVVVMVGGVEAHTTTIKVSCAGLAVQADWYPDDTPYTVSVDGDVVESGTFDGSLHDSWDSPDLTEAHEWSVVIDSPDGDGFDVDETRQIEACEEPTTTSTSTTTTTAATTTTTAATTTTIVAATTTTPQTTTTVAATSTTAAPTTTAATVTTTTVAPTTTAATTTTIVASGGPVTTAAGSGGILPATGASEGFLLKLSVIALGFLLVGVLPAYWAWWRRRNGYSR